MTLARIAFGAALAAVGLAPAADIPRVTTAAATRLDGTSRPWAYVVVSESEPGLLQNRRLVAYVKNSAPDIPGVFVSRGPLVSTEELSAIQVHLQRAEKLGDDLVDLEGSLRGLHLMILRRESPPVPEITAAPAMPLASRFALLQHRAAEDRSVASYLDLLGVSHPSIRLVRGTAWTGPLDVAAGTDVTIEVRELDATGDTVAVLGRVALRAGQPVDLPAPGPLVVVPDKSASGDLNHALRWALSAELRKAVFPGTIVWRVNAAFAESRGFNAAPPGAAELAAFAITHPTDVKRITPGPVAAPQLYDAGDVGIFPPRPFGEPHPSFVIDDNDRDSVGGVAATEGAAVYYFAAAVDLLGHAGQVSPGILARFNRRLPPALPARFGVELAWTSTTGQHFDLRWAQNPALPGPSTTRYEIYRGSSLAYHSQANRDELDLDQDPIVPADPDGIRRVGTVADPGGVSAVLMHFADTSVPAVDANLGRTWWFAVRAVHDGPLGTEPTASILSPPVFAGLRQHRGPDAPRAVISPECLRVHCYTVGDPIAVTSPEPLDRSVVHYVARCTRINQGVTAAQFRVRSDAHGGGDELIPWTQVEFPPDAAHVDFTFTRPRETASTAFAIDCRGVAFQGTFSQPATHGVIGTTELNRYELARFESGAITESERVAAVLSNVPPWNSLQLPDPDDCDGSRRITISPLTGKIIPVGFWLIFPERSVEYRIYRRIDDGPLTLVTQGARLPVDTAQMNLFDQTPPTTCCRLTYFAQVIDENGNTSAMTQIDSAIVPAAPPVAPMLNRPAPEDLLGDASGPRVNLSWVCPPSGVDRFEVYVTTVAADPAPAVSAPGLAWLQPAAYPILFTTKSEVAGLATLQSLQYYHLTTGRVGGTFGAGPKFTLPVSVEPYVKYRVWVRGLGACGEVGLQSRTIEFAWEPPASPSAGVPWPARPLPAVGSFHPGIKVRDFSDASWGELYWNNQTQTLFPDQTPVGIRVGSILQPASAYLNMSPYGDPSLSIPDPVLGAGKSDPNTQVYRHSGDGKTRLLPAVLYRQQVANALFPAVTGDIVQCSPMVRDVAWTVWFPDRLEFGLADPYFRWTKSQPHGEPPVIELYLVDTQPVSVGATYRYLLVRFTDLGEPEQTIPCGNVTLSP